ncbi:MAG: ATP-binding protein [Pseudomonadota bacterium]
MSAEPGTGQPPVQSSLPAATRIVIPSDPVAVQQGLKALFDTLLLRQLDEADRGRAELVLAEALNNIVEHAYAEAGGEIELTLCLNGQGLNCRIVDHGAPMPGEALPQGILDAPEDLPEGGFGWYLIRTLAEDLRYARVADQNQLTFRLTTEQSAA